MVFNGFDLGIKDKNGRSICVGDIIEYDTIDGEIKLKRGQIVYSPSLFCFCIDWGDGDLESSQLNRYQSKFWNQVHVQYKAI